MEEYKIKRINELAKKAREQELTPEDSDRWVKQPLTGSKKD